MSGTKITLNDLGLPEGMPLRREYEVTPRDVAEKLAQDPKGVLVIDVRTQPEWDLVRVEGSVHIPLDELERRVDEIEPAPGQLVATICHHGVRSLKASLALRELGMPQAMSIAGGIDVWSMAVDPTLPRYDRQGGRCTVIQ